MGTLNFLAFTSSQAGRWKNLTAQLDQTALETAKQQFFIWANTQKLNDVKCPKFGVDKRSQVDSLQLDRIECDDTLVNCQNRARHLWPGCDEGGRAGKSSNRFVCKNQEAFLHALTTKQTDQRHK